MKKKEEKKVSKLSKLLSRFLVLIIFVLIGLIALKSNLELRSFVYKNVFQNNLKFAKLDEIYEKYFGSSIPNFKDDTALVSKEKIDYTDLEEYKDGVKLKISDDYVIPSLRSGIITFAGEKDGVNTVILEDSDGVEHSYFNLKEIKVGMYDYIKEGQTIGSASGEVILEFRKDGKKVDYKKYI